MRRTRAYYLARAEPGSGAREAILALERALWRKQAAVIDSMTAASTPAFRRYRRDYRQRVRRFAAVSSMREVMRDVGRSDVVYVGDYHTLAASQRTFAELVTRAAARGRPLTLALEFVESRFQPALDAYCRGRIGEATFLARIEYARRHAPDLWSSYRPVLELARRLQLPVVGIDRRGDTDGSPQARDVHASASIARALSAAERPLVLVLAGQLHVAPPHLPRAVDRALAAAGSPPVSSLVVYQNCDELYWDLATRGLRNQVKAVLVAPGEYCLFSSSPVMCQQSFLDRVDGEGDLLEGDAEGQFKDMARMVAALLRVDVDDDLDEVEVYPVGDLSFVESMRQRGLFTTADLRALRRQVLSLESCYVPRARAVYLGTMSVNHAAEEASHFVRHVCAGDTLGCRRGLIDGFYARALEEAMAFFGSKTVRPERACAREADFRRMLRGDERALRHTAAMVLAHKRLERGERAPPLARLWSRTDPLMFERATHALGYMLGDDLYVAMRRGRLPRREIRELFRDPFDEDGAAFQTYLYLARRFGRR